MRRCLIPLSLLSIATPAAAQAAENALLPPAVREMLEAAIANGNETEIATVAKIAKQTNPASTDQIQRMVNSWKERTKATHDTVIREAGIGDLWTGRIEAGGFRSTGGSPLLHAADNLHGYEIHAGRIDVESGAARPFEIPPDELRESTD